MKEKECGRERFVPMTVLFAVYMFEYMVSMVYVQEQYVLSAPGEWVVRGYYLDLLCTALGFAGTFLYAGRYRDSGKHGSGILLWAACVCTGVFSVLLMVSFRLWVFVLVSCIFCLSFGFAGGVVYYRMSGLLSPTDYMGRSMGIGASAALLTQFLLQHGLQSGLFQAGLIIVGALVTTIILSWKLPAAMEAGQDFAENDGGREKPELHRKAVRTAIRVLVITVLIGVFVVYYNENMLRMIAETGYEERDIYSWPRLFGIVSYLVIGFVGDIKKRRLVPFVTLCLIIPGMIVPLVPMSSSFQMLNMALFYIAVMAQIAYYNLMFWDVAPKTGKPYLWSGMGRIVAAISEIVFLMLNITALSDVAMLGVELVILVLIILNMAWNGDLNPGGLIAASPEQTGIPSEYVPEYIPVQKLEMMKQYQEKFKLTEMETEVLKRLISTEDSQQQLADSLDISSRSLQRHITSIYDKTGVRTRVGLLISYTQFLTDEGAMK